MIRCLIAAKGYRVAPYDVHKLLLRLSRLLLLLLWLSRLLLLLWSSTLLLSPP
jgi:hypothetical protein